MVGLAKSRLLQQRGLPSPTLRKPGTAPGGASRRQLQPTHASFALAPGNLLILFKNLFVPVPI